jgi:hypothetical protein
LPDLGLGGLAGVFRLPAKFIMILKTIQVEWNLKGNLN